MDLGGGEDEHHMGRRFFERLEQGVERRIRQHVHFVNDADPVHAAKRRELDVFADFPDVIHARIRRAVNLDDVH